MKVKKKRVLSFSGVSPLKLFGPRESHLQILEDRFPGMVVVRGDEVILRGPDKELRRLTEFFGDLFDIARTGRDVSEQDYYYLLEGGTGAARSEQRGGAGVLAGRENAVALAVA